MKYEWKSALSAQIEAFIKAKQLAGFKYESQSRILRHYDSYSYAKGIGGCRLVNEDVDGFCYGTYYEKACTIRNKETVLHDLGQYIQDCGDDAYICQKKTKVRRCRYTPYIYSENEICAFFRVIDGYHYRYKSTNRKLYPLFFRMLYGCGLRLSEALQLNVSDVDIQAGTIFIRQSKNDRTRMIPMAESLRQRCSDYLAGALPANTDGVFFPNTRGNFIDHTTVYNKFREFLWAAGIHHTRQGPRIHDFRHTYCVHCMKNWVLSGKDIQNLQPYLMTYMGHADFRGTEYYLRLTADLYPDIVEKCEVALGWLIPETAGPYCD